MKTLRNHVAGAALAAFCAFTGIAEAQTFTLNGVVFDESAYFTPEELQAVAAPYIGRPIAFDDLSRMMAALQALYTEAGIVTAQPILPAQTLTNKVLRVALLEARIDAVRIEGLERTSPDFLRRTISLQEGERPDYDQIERDLRIYELVHDIAPRIGFAPGAELGTATATISGVEPDPLTVTLSLDNFGREETGRARATLFARYTSLTGLRDTLTATAQKSRDAGSYSLGYSRPVGTQGGRLAFGASISDASIVADPATGLTVLSDTIVLSASYRQPFAITPTDAFFFDLGVQAERSESTIGGAPFTEVDLVDVTATLSWQRREVGRSIGFDIGLRVGVADALGATPTEGAYAILSFGGAYARQVTETLVFEGTLRGQVAPGANLPVARLFGVGGSSSVRGYPLNVQSGDSGVLVRAQILRAEPFVPAAMPRLGVGPFAFLDAAAVYPFGGGTETLASVGGGVRLSWDNRISGLVMAAVPLRNTTNFNDRGKPAIYAGLDVSF